MAAQHSRAMACSLPTFAPPFLVAPLERPSLQLRNQLFPFKSSYTHHFLPCFSSFSSVSRVLRKVASAPSPFPAYAHQPAPAVCSPVSFFKLGSPPAELPEIVEAGDPVLHEPASPVPVSDIPSERIQKVIDDMVAVMRAAPGVGLAAPQIGIPLQLIVLEDTKEYISYAPKEETIAQQRYPFDLLVLCNPKLTKKGDSTARFFEGCVSVKGYRGLVERHLEVEVAGFGRDGRPIKVDAFGWQARILQHECDHLKGILYVDRLIPHTFRTINNLRLPLAAGCPNPGVSLKHGGSVDLIVD